MSGSARDVPDPPEPDSGFPGLVNGWFPANNTLVHDWRLYNYLADYGGPTGDDIMSLLRTCRDDLHQLAFSLSSVISDDKVNISGGVTATIEGSVDVVGGPVDVVITTPP